MCPGFAHDGYQLHRVITPVHGFKKLFEIVGIDDISGAGAGDMPVLEADELLFGLLVRLIELCEGVKGTRNAVVPLDADDVSASQPLDGRIEQQRAVADECRFIEWK